VREVDDPEGETPPSKPRPKNALNELDVRSWMKFTKSWFVCNPPPRSKNQVRHPAKFPEALAAEFIRFFTRPGETVLDPFSGTGSTVRASYAEGRRGLGIEISPDFLAISEAHRTDASQEIFLQGDAREAEALSRSAGVERVDYVLTSPPYWDMLRQSRGGVRSAQKERAERGLPTEYAGSEQDLGVITDYEEFLTELVGIFTGLRPLLAPNRYLTVVIQNVRVPGGEVRPLAWDLTRLLSDTYTFKGERIWLQDNKRLGCWGWPSEYVTNVHHHYCLTFKNDR
jgi:DNA modification methylase